MTGIASGTVLGFNMVEGSDIVKVENERVAKLIGINKAARTTCVKPAGTTSLHLELVVVFTLGTPLITYAEYAWVKMKRFTKYLSTYHPNMIEDDYFNAETQAVISAPQKAPEDAVYRTESALQLLKRVKKVSEEWVRSGHREGQNTHNVSATISVKDSEWVDVESGCGRIESLTMDYPFYHLADHTYKQAPFEDCSKETYDVMMQDLTGVDLNFV